MLQVCKSLSVYFVILGPACYIHFPIQKLNILMVLIVWRLVFSSNLVAGSSLERWWAQVVQDVQKSTEYDALGSHFKPP